MDRRRLDAISVPAATLQGVTRRIEKPWGYELIFAETDSYVGKRIHIRSGHRLSLQFHAVKDETIFVESGELELELVENGVSHKMQLRPDESHHIAPGVIHRMSAVTDVDIIEVSTPELADVVRLEDDYGRAGTSTP